MNEMSWNDCWLSQRETGQLQTKCHIEPKCSQPMNKWVTDVSTIANTHLRFLMNNASTEQVILRRQSITEQPSSKQRHLQHTIFLPNKLGHNSKMVRDLIGKKKISSTNSITSNGVRNPNPIILNITLQRDIEQ